MTTYTMTGPDGKDYSIDGPPGASEAEVRAQMQKAHADLGSAAPAGTDMGVNSAVQRGFASGATFGLAKTDPTTAAAHPIATGIGETLGGVMGGSAELHGITAGAKAVSRFVPGVVSRVVDAAGLALTLKAGQPIANVARLAGSGAAAGATYGATAGGVSGGQQDGASGVLPGAASGAATGAVTGAVAGPVVAGVVKGVQAARAAVAPASKRAIALLAKHLDMSADGVEAMVTDHMAATGMPPTIADILNAKSVANLAPDVNAYQSSSAKMMAAEEANKDLAPGRQVLAVARANPAGTQTPLAAAPKLVAARSAPLEEMRAAQIKATMDPIRSHAVNLQPAEADFLKGEVTSEMGLRGPIRKQIANELEHNQISIDSIDAIRKNLNKLDHANPGYGYGELANGVEQIGRAHPEYAKALDEYAANSRFIDGFNHANAGNSALDASGAADRATLQSAEGQAGLQVGARSRLIATAGASRSGATSTTNQLAQDTATPLNESLPPDEVYKLRLSAQAEQRSQGNYGGLSVSSLSPKSNETTKSIKSAGEAVVATAAHAFPTTRWHAVSRLLLGNGIRESTANALTDILTSRDPAVFRTLPDALRAANVTREQQRVILNVAAKRGAAGAGAVFNSLTNGQ